MRTARLPSWAWLALIVLAGAALRAAAFTGQSFSFGSDESRFIAVAQNLANGYFPSSGAEWFGTRIGLIWPVAAVFRVTHADDFTASAWPMVGSLLSIVAAYLLGRDLASRRAGLIAAAIVALAPLEALVGVRLRPDAIMPGLLGLAVWLALRGGRGGSWRWAAGAGVMLGIAWSVRESALVLAPVLALTLWPAGRRALGAAAAGALAIPFITAVVFAVGAGDPLRPLIGAGTEGEWRNPVSALSFDKSYVAMIGRAAFDPGASLFLLAPVIVVASGVVLYRRDRRAVLPAVWLAWTALYLEFGTLVNLAKPARYLTLCTIPAALLVALAADGRLGFLVPAAVAVAAVAALWTLPARDLRHDDVMLVARVGAKLRSLPAGPVLSESYTWWAKLGTYGARGRLTVPAARDPEFASPSEVRSARRLAPLPVPADVRGRGYVVTGPVHPRPGWPTNWDRVRSRMSREIAPGSLTLVATVGEARIWRWNP